MINKEKILSLCERVATEARDTDKSIEDIVAVVDRAYDATVKEKFSFVDAMKKRMGKKPRRSFTDKLTSNKANSIYDEDGGDGLDDLFGDTIPPKKKKGKRTATKSNTAKFGKYKGKEINWIIKNDYNYYKWANENGVVDKWRK